MRPRAGDRAPRFDTEDIEGRPISIEALSGTPVFLAFHRFSNCPFCNIRIHKIRSRHSALVQRGVAVITVFESSLENLRAGVARQKLPFPIVSDSAHRLYELYGVGRSAQGHARALELRGGDVSAAKALGLVESIEHEGSVEQMPADFLIKPDGRIDVAYYGKDAGDHLDFSIIETFSHTYGTPTPTSTRRVP